MQIWFSMQPCWLWESPLSLNSPAVMQTKSSGLRSKRRLNLSYTFVSFSAAVLKYCELLEADRWAHETASFWAQRSTKRRLASVEQPHNKDRHHLNNFNKNVEKISHKSFTRKTTSIFRRWMRHSECKGRSRRESNRTKTSKKQQRKTTTKKHEGKNG